MTMSGMNSIAGSVPSGIEALMISGMFSAWAIALRTSGSSSGFCFWFMPRYSTLKGSRSTIWKPSSVSGATSAGPTRSKPSISSLRSASARALGSSIATILTWSTMDVSPQ